jgi:hypothetical protein
MEQWQVQSNVEAFGYYEAAKMLKKRKVSFEQAYVLIFGRAPRMI